MPLSPRFWDYAGRLMDMARRKSVTWTSYRFELLAQYERWFDVPMWFYDEMRVHCDYPTTGKDGDRVTMLGIPVRALVGMDSDGLRFVETAGG